jgi:trimeric autotransporter adhesin
MSQKYFKVKTGVSTPLVSFTNSVNSNIQVSYLDSNTLSFSGTSGQLFSITDSMTGTIFAVNDISGVPSIEVDDTGVIRFAETFGNVLIGTANNLSNTKLYINGSLGLTGAINVNSSVGTAGQVLTSNGSIAYWATTADANLVQSNLTTLTTSVNTIKANVDSVAGNVTTLTTSVNTIKANIDSVAGNVTTLTTSVNTIKANVDSVAGNVTTLTTSVNTIKANVDSVAGNVTTLTTSVNTIKANVDSVAGNVTTLTTSVNTIKANVDSVQSNVATTVSSVNTVQSNLTTLTTSVNTIKANVDSVQSNVATTVSSVNTVQSNLTTLTTSVNTIKANVDSVAGNVTTTVSSVNTVQSNLTTLTTSVNTIKANVDSVAGNVTTLTTSVNTIRANVDSVQSNVDAILSGTSTINNPKITGSLSANASIGTAGQVLTSNGSIAYWATPSAGVTKYSTNIGNGSAMTFTITHNLNTADIFVAVREVSSGYFVYPDVQYTSVNTIDIEFNIVPTTNQYYVSIIGV